MTGYVRKQDNTKISLSNWHSLTTLSLRSLRNSEECLSRIPKSQPPDLISRSKIWHSLATLVIRSLGFIRTCLSTRRGSHNVPYITKHFGQNLASFPLISPKLAKKSLISPNLGGTPPPPGGYGLSRQRAKINLCFTFS